MDDEWTRWDTPNHRDPNVDEVFRLAAENERLRAVVEADPEALARRFHETYEALAPRFGYETRRESAVPWDQVPENNRRLMVAVCAALLDVSEEGATDG